MPPLPPAIWLARRAAHERRVDAWIRPHLERASRQERHPVYDFLFEYYSFRPAHLRRWSPGVDVTLTGPEADAFLTLPFFRRDEAGVRLDPSLLPEKRRAFARWLADLLAATARRAPFFGCAGLHEWAMVYRTPDVRHRRWPLRLGSAGTDAVVEALPIRCSHYDAFRFFTPDALPLNRLQPTRESTPALEQPACLHANMDLYKWAYKLAPFTSAELIADCFALARDIREVDMRASPYDFAALGFEPICIETPEGRADYERHQRAFAERAAPLRARLTQVAEQLSAAAAPSSP